MRRLRTLALVVLGSCLFSALGYGAALTRAASGDSGHPPPDAPVTAEVELRRIQSSVVARGDASFAGQVKVALAPSAPVPVITATPVAEGDVVTAGDVLAEITGRPVLLLPGRLPAYRDLGDGDTGPDVAQLERALDALGHHPGAVDDVYTPATGAAVAALYADRGYRPPAAEGAEGGEGGEGGAGRRQGVTPLPRSEIAYAPGLPRRVDRLPGHVGTTLPATPVVLSGTRLVVTVGLTTADTGVVDDGMRAVVDLPSGGHVTGRLSDVRRTATGGTATVRLPALRAETRNSLKGANVRVTVPLRASAGDVLVVPVAALSTDARGVVRVVRVDDDGGLRPVRVDLGLAADGYAEVRPRDGHLRPGDGVVVGR
jgi:peptidoglycan hydrolase-like protein with peptidoglycan-binding domain